MTLKEGDFMHIKDQEELTLQDNEQLSSVPAVVLIGMPCKSTLYR